MSGELMKEPAFSFLINTVICGLVSAMMPSLMLINGMRYLYSIELPNFTALVIADLNRFYT